MSTFFVIYTTQQAAALPDPADFLGYTQGILDAVEHGNWWVLAALLLTGLVAAVRALVPKFSEKYQWLKTDRGSAVLVLGMAALGAAATTIAAWTAPNWALLGTAVLVAVSSAGGYVLIKKIFWPSDK